MSLWQLYTGRPLLLVTFPNVRLRNVTKPEIAVGLAPASGLPIRSKTGKNKPNLTSRLVENRRRLYCPLVFARLYSAMMAGVLACK